MGMYCDLRRKVIRWRIEIFVEEVEVTMWVVIDKLFQPPD